MNAKMLWSYLWRGIPDLIVVLSTWIILCWPLALFSLWWGPKLPKYLQWFSTLNNTLDGGWDELISGYRDPASLRWWQLWWQRICWICRNPAQGWQSQTFLGMDGKQLVFIQKDETSNPKWYLMESKGVRFFMWKKDQHLFGDWYLKLYFGWHDDSRSGDGRHQYELQIKPFRR